jgi:hypothetical protein
VTVTRYFCQILVQLKFLDIFSKNLQISNLMKTLPVGTELFHADGRTEINDEADSRFSQFCERIQQNLMVF